MSEEKKEKELSIVEFLREIKGLVESTYRIVATEKPEQEPIERQFIPPIPHWHHRGHGHGHNDNFLTLRLSKEDAAALMTGILRVAGGFADGLQKLFDDKVLWGKIFSEIRPILDRISKEELERVKAEEAEKEKKQEVEPKETPKTKAKKA